MIAVWYDERLKTRLLGVACLVVLSITLSLGLWPFHAPKNQVNWLGQTNGLAYGRHGTVLSSSPFSSPTSRGQTSRSVEIWVQPYPYHSGTFLSFFNRQDSLHVSFRLSIVDFELQVDTPRRGHRPAESLLYVDDVLRYPKPVFVAVTSGEDGTVVYIDGVARKTAPQFRIAPEAFQGDLILGDAPWNPDSWRGQVRGIAVYDAELTAGEVVRHYDTWKSDGQPKVEEGERAVAIYLLDEHAGSIIHNRIRPGIDLLIPERYTVEEKLALQPFWNEFRFSRSYLGAAIKNVVGFVPFGFSFYWFLTRCRWKRAALATLAAGLAVSLTIETLQIFLPTRDSGTTDLLTNTFGTWIGILAFQAVSSLVRL